MLIHFIILIVLSTVAMAGEFPIILKHSETTIAVYEGDVVKLSVEATNAEEYRWFEEKNPTCKTTTCEFDTMGFEEGAHRFIAVVINASGSRTINFIVHVLEKKPGHVPGSVVPKLVNAQPVKLKTIDEQYKVSVLSGRGYVFTQKEFQVIGNDEINIEDNKKIRTQADSWLRIRLEGKEDFFVGPNSEVVFKYENNKRLMQLNKGSLRYRNLRKNQQSEKDLVVEVGTAKIFAAALSDFYISKEDKLKLQVFRGAVQMLENTYTAPVEIVENTEVRPLHELSLDDLFEETTPHLTFDDSKNYEKDSKSLVVDQLFPQDQKDKAYAAAQKKFYDEKDYEAVLEILLPFSEQDNFSSLMLLAWSSYNLGLIDQAETLATMASEKNKDFASPYSLKGLIFFERKQWVKSEESFSESASKKFTTDGELKKPDVFYHLGLIHFYLEQDHQSRSAFEKSLWLQKDETKKKSAKDYLEELENRRNFTLNLYGGLFSDSNLFKRQDFIDTDLPDDLKNNAATGIHTDLQAKYFRVHSKKAEVSLGLEFDRRDFLTASFRGMGILQQTFSLNLARNWFRSDRQIFGIALTPYLKLDSVGQKRALDTMGFALTLKTFFLTDTLWVFKQEKGVDPFPAEQHFYDPATATEAFATDRSVSIRRLSADFKILKKESFLLAFKMDRETFDYASEFSAASSFNTSRMTVPMTYFFSRRSNLDFNPFYQKTSFTVTRDDTLTGVLVKHKYFLNPSLLLSSELGFASNTSSIDEYNYKKNYGELGLGWSY